MTRNRSRPRKPCPFSSLLRFIGSLLRGKPSSQHVCDVPDEFMSAHAPQDMTGSLYNAQPFLQGAPPPLPAAYYAQGKDVQWSFNARPVRPALPAEWYYPAYPAPPSSSAHSAYYTAASHPAPSHSSSSSYTAVSTPATAATYASSTATTALPYPPHPSYPPQTASTRAAHGHAASSFSRPLVAHGHAAPSSSRPLATHGYAATSSRTRVAQGLAQTSSRAQHNVQTSGPRHVHLAQSAGGAVHVQRGDGRPATRAHAQFYTAWHDPQFSQAYVPARANDSVVVRPSRSRRY